MVVVGSLIGRQLATNRLSKGCDTPCLGRVRRVSPYPLTGGQNLLVFLEDPCAPEGQGIVDAASMANSIIHDDEGIGESDKLVEGQMAIAKIKIKTHLAVQRVRSILVKPGIAMKARPLEQRELCSIDHKMPVAPLRAYLLCNPCLCALLLLGCWKMNAFVV